MKEGILTEGKDPAWRCSYTIGMVVFFFPIVLAFPGVGFINNIITQVVFDRNKKIGRYHGKILS